ncbi:ketose-bisphosphate aldolase [uncultured Enorma sp.]|uniref:ketose-bisphosphate aldolase n=1 Tax=uncultured Enorma sp. TaxID=1714346 RepID=UPI002595E08B|nr:ketose-bisphosphate aldolase [uncultured Enorma sp.]
MLTTVADLLAAAEEGSYTVGAYNVTESSMLRAVVEVAEECRAPAIIAAAVNEFEFAEPEFYAYARARLERSPVPLALHLDHGHSFGDCMRAIRAGFTGVMIDGSLLPYEENVALTRKVVEAAHEVGVSVEGEIGTIGAKTSEADDGVEGIHYTDPDDVEDFVSRTGVDALAIAIGTAHGQYPAGYEPHLKLDLISEIRSRTRVPLVLHGGSNNPDEEIEQACRLGLRKVNISSDFKVAYYRAVGAYLDATGDFYPAKVLPHGMDEVKRVVRRKMELFGCMGRA